MTTWMRPPFEPGIMSRTLVSAAIRPLATSHHKYTVNPCGIFILIPEIVLVALYLPATFAGALPFRLAGIVPVVALRHCVPSIRTWFQNSSGLSAGSPAASRFEQAIRRLSLDDATILPNQSALGHQRSAHNT